MPSNRAVSYQSTLTLTLPFHVMARPDRATALNIALPRVARSGRAMTCQGVLQVSMSKWTGIRRSLSVCPKSAR
jgi:hypothetical protein